MRHTNCPIQFAAPCDRATPVIVTSNLSQDGAKPTLQETRMFGPDLPPARCVVPIQTFMLGEDCQLPAASTFQLAAQRVRYLSEILCFAVALERGMHFQISDCF